MGAADGGFLAGCSLADCADAASASFARIPADFAQDCNPGAELGWGAGQFLRSLPHFLTSMWDCPGRDRI